jgi:Curli production assembly/transport component CsgG
MLFLRKPVMPISRGAKRIRILAHMILGGMILAGCAANTRSGAGPTSVAVWDPEALGLMSAAQKAMGKVMAGRILDLISRSPGYEVVEREDLIKILEEQHLGSSSLIDDQTRLQLGRIIGCRQMVFGAYQVIGNVMRLDIRNVDVSTGKILKTAAGTVPADDLNGWLEAAAQAATDMLRP